MANLKKPGIIFDFDDTLVYSHELFLVAQEQFCAAMEELGLHDEALLATLEQRDIENVRQAGYLAAECFAMALGQTYQHYCQKFGRKAEAAEEKKLSDLGWLPYYRRPRAMEGAHNVLAQLKTAPYRDYRLIMFTQGEPDIQRKRVDDSGFAHYFDTISIVRIKDATALAALVEAEQLAPEQTWYVGNSLRADINPAIAVGLRAVHFDIRAWSYEHEPPQGGYQVISRLEQFTELLLA